MMPHLVLADSVSLRRGSDSLKHQSYPLTLRDYALLLNHLFGVGLKVVGVINELPDLVIVLPYNHALVLEIVENLEILHW